MQKNTRYPRIVLADDYPPFLEEVERFLRNDHEIVGLAHDGEEALSLCLALNPDIVLLDLSMPILCGLEVATRLGELGCKSRIIFVTGQEDRDYVEAAFSLGASGYVLKGSMRTDLLQAIDAALNSSTFVSSFPANAGIPPRR